MARSDIASLRRRTLDRLARVLLAVVVFATPNLAPSARADLVRWGGSPVYWLGGPDEGELVAMSASGLLREESRLAMWLSTGGLPPLTATTVWWVVFNEPEACTASTPRSRCGRGDLADPATKPSWQYAAGGIADARGTAGYAAVLPQGSADGCVDGLPCSGLESPLDADVHLVIRQHGMARDPVQLLAYDGGCASNSCSNLQVAIHDAVPRDVQAARVVPIVMSNMRYCRSPVCIPADQAYQREPAAAAVVYNPQGVIDVRPGDTVTWIYQDGSWCDVASYAPYCPGHNVVFEDGSVRSPLLQARSTKDRTFSWTVPESTPSGTVIPYYCDIYFHYRVGMTGALRVV